MARAERRAAILDWRVREVGRGERRDRQEVPSRVREGKRKERKGRPGSD